MISRHSNGDPALNLLRALALRTTGLPRGRCAAHDPQCDLTAVRASLFATGFALDHKDLSNMREVETGIERRAAPNTPRLNAARIRRRDLDEIGGAARLEQ